ncbi:hypothetical protein GCM10028806_33140 [Spirosoma terrae]|uniref:Uncharacterized protein n=1 Tax=Spirosoma terrae TaxID=1968276 RepID=A0A6L9LB06_9BACT|nr:hypothetical protein [Spirosoma terrae]NDU95628.1 hypothetical protein [Spirosoma terrae]
MINTQVPAFKIELRQLMDKYQIPNGVFSCPCTDTENPPKVIDGEPIGNTLVLMMNPNE